MTKHTRLSVCFQLPQGAIAEGLRESVTLRVRIRLCSRHWTAIFPWTPTAFGTDCDSLSRSVRDGLATKSKTLTAFAKPRPAARIR